MWWLPPDPVKVFSFSLSKKEWPIFGRCVQESFGLWCQTIGRSPKIKMVSKQVALRVPEPLRLKLINRSRAMGTNQSQVILLALKSYLK